MNTKSQSGSNGRQNKGNTTESTEKRREAGRKGGEARAKEMK